MTSLQDKLKRLVEFDPNNKSLVGQFRHCVYPDADKDTVITFQADVACYGFEVGRGATYSELKPLLDALIECVEGLIVVSNNGDNRGMGWTPAQHARITLANLERVVKEME